MIFVVEKTETLRIHEFEREHFPCAKEWWCAEGFFNTIENNKKWSFKVDLYQAMSRSKSIWSIYSITIFDLDNRKTFSYNFINDNLKLETVKDSFYVKCGKSYINGSFPTYQMNFFDPIKNINLNLKYQAESLPYFVAQQITNG